MENCYSPSRSEFIDVRGVRCHVRHWGREGAPKLFMVHGWMDVSASFQFIVDALEGEWHVIAPDLRGFGLTGSGAVDSYWFPDYLGDLDAVLEHYAPGGAVNLLGHSMGGNVVSIYAGVRPERIAKLVNLEGFGLVATSPDQAPGRYAKWLDELRKEFTLPRYDDKAGVAARLRKTNPRLTEARAEFLAGHWAAPDAEGKWSILGDPAHKRSNPVRYLAEDVLECWKRITAPMLWVEGEHTFILTWLGPRGESRVEVDRRLGFIADLQKEMVADAGHMLHHDQPETVARLVERFLAS